MTDEAKALVYRMRNLQVLEYPHDRIRCADLIETQAREIERLREACDKADSLADHWFVEYETLRDGLIDILARAALAGDSHV